MTMISRSAAAPAGLRLQRSASHTTIVSWSSDTVYTFSFTTDWFQTVKLVAPTRAHTAAEMSRAPRLAKRPLVTSCATRNQIPAEAGIWFLVAHEVTKGLFARRGARLISAAVCALVGATSFTVWNQSVVNEKVYTVSLLQLTIVVWLALRWSRNPAGAAGDRAIH